MADQQLPISPVTVGFIDTSKTVSQTALVTAANPLPVTIAGGSGTNQNVNLAQIAGATAASGDVNNQTAVTGMLDVLGVARYNATLPTITDTRYNAWQVGQRGALQVQVMNADGTTGWAFASPADGQTLAASSAPVRAVIGAYNGTNTDMARSIGAAANTGTGTLATALTPLSGTLLTRVGVNITTGTTTAIVAGTASQIVRVYQMTLNIAAAQTINIISSGGASLVGAAMSFAAAGQYTLMFSGQPWFVTTIAEGLSFVTSTTGAVTGTVHYIKAA